MKLLENGLKRFSLYGQKTTYVYLHAGTKVGAKNLRKIQKI